ncbi:hypothetical protein ACN4EG_08170 [Alkalinema pantanalense CENA528]
MIIQLLILFVAANSVIIACNALQKNEKTENLVLDDFSNDQASDLEDSKNGNFFESMHAEKVKYLEQEALTKSRVISEGITRTISRYEKIIAKIDQGLKRDDQKHDETLNQEERDRIDRLRASALQSRDRSVFIIEHLLSEQNMEFQLKQRQQIAQRIRQDFNKTSS